MNKNQFLQNWLLPPRFYAMYKNTEKILLNKYSMYLHRNTLPDFSTIKQVKNIHKGERCFILATGPSLGKMDLKQLKGEKIIAIHDSWLHPDFDFIQPQYHMIAPYHAPFTFDDVRRRLDGIKQTYQWPMKLFLGYTFFPFSVNNFLRINSGYQFSEVYNINYSAGRELNENNYLSERPWNIEKKPFIPLTGNMQAIQIALYLGFSEIILLGLDHTFAKTITPEGTPHFYNVNEGQNDDEQHRITFNRKDIYYRLYKLWHYYQLIRKYTEKNNINVYNASLMSELDVFQRVKLNKILSQ